MNRRDFLKLIPATIVSATVLSRLKPVEEEINISDITEKDYETIKIINPITGKIEELCIYFQ